MTEDEAKKKFCPMGGRSASINNGNFTIGQFTLCLASECMAWQHANSVWCKDGEEVDLHLYKEYRTPEEAGLVSLSKGRCGLAK